MSEEHRDGEDERTARIARGIRVVREGHGANCSSIGSVVDTLFAAAVVGGAVLAAVAAALARQDVRVVGSRAAPDGNDATGGDAAEREEPRS